MITFSSKLLNMHNFINDLLLGRTVVNNYSTFLYTLLLSYELYFFYLKSTCIFSTVLKELSQD